MDIFKSKETTRPSKTEMIYDPYSSLRQNLSDWLNSQLGKSGPTYSGDRVAKMTDQEKQSLDYLGDYAKSGTSQTTKLAADEINKTLSGGYDPSTSPYYQAVKAQSIKNLKDTQDQIAQQASMGGRYFSGGRLKAQSDAAVDVTNSLNTLMGSLSENERQRRLDVLPQAMSMGNYLENEPLRKTAALQTYGSLPREIEQAVMDAVYQDWYGSNVTYPMSIANAASGLASQQPVMSYTPEQTVKEDNQWGKMFMKALPYVLAMV